MEWVCIATAPWAGRSAVRFPTRARDEICALLEYYAASSGYPLPTFRDNLSVPSSRVFLDFLTLEDGTDRLYRNVGKLLPLDAAYYPRRAEISSTSRRRPDITESKRFSLLQNAQTLGAPGLLFNGYRGVSSRFIWLTTHQNLVPGLRMRGAVVMLLLYAVMTCAGATWPLPFSSCELCYH
jgi:hypothetical protein